MSRILIAMLATISLCVTSIILAADSMPELVEIEGLITANPIPSGHETGKLDDVIVNGKVVASKLMVVKTGSVSKVIITIERNKRETHKSRASSFTGYVDGTIEMLQGAGFNVQKKKMPDLKLSDFGKPQFADLVLTGPEKNTLYARVYVFFSDSIYALQIIGANQSEFETLCKWSQTVKGK